MSRSSRTPARLVIALSVAGVLAIFLVYTALKGTTPALQPSNLSGHTGTVSLTGKVIGPVMGDSHQANGLAFKLHNINGVSPVIPIVFHGVRARPVQGRPRREPHRPHAGRIVRRDGPDDEVPEQVHLQQHLAPRDG